MTKLSFNFHFLSSRNKHKERIVLEFVIYFIVHGALGLWLCKILALFLSCHC